MNLINFRSSASSNVRPKFGQKIIIRRMNINTGISFELFLIYNVVCSNVFYEMIF